MVREALVRELAGRFVKILREIEGAEELSLSDLMGVISIAFNQFIQDRKSCEKCRSQTDAQGP